MRATLLRIRTFTSEIIIGERPMKKLGFLAVGLTSCLLGAFLNSPGKINTSIVENAEKIFGLSFTETQRDSMLDNLNEQLENFENLRKLHMPNSTWPSLLFNPIPPGFVVPTGKSSFTASKIADVKRPANLEDLAFYSIQELANLLRNRRVTSVELTTMYLSRLKKYGPKLECVITLTEDLAMKQARRADEEIANGKYRGLLQGIPYGAKDLLAVKGYKTTWGAMPYRDQMIDQDATVIRRLEEAGAVLVAKLTMGALAWGDVWYGGKTRNPWNIERGSSGSSAGSASATAAGLVAFAIGTETWGSIVSPSSECGATGLRPTYGRVSRHGAMALAWTMDKIGPICRNVEDCAIVLNAIVGPDGLDPTLYDYPFVYDPYLNIKKLRVGYLKSDFDRDSTRAAFHQSTFEVLGKLGVTLTPIELPKLPVNDIAFMLSAEAAAAFDDLTLSHRDEQLVRQVKNAWPNVFRSARFIPAVEYIQASRARTLVIQDMDERLRNIDVYLAPPFEGDNLLLTNLTGHPCVVLPNGFDEKGLPRSITFMGKLFGEGEVLALAKRYQDATEFHKKHPALK